MFNRRLFLRAAPAAAVAAAVVAPALAVEPLPDTRPYEERVREKVAELKALMREVYPVEQWHWCGIVAPTNARECQLLISLTARGPGAKVEDTER
jgi:hypothetical protein